MPTISGITKDASGNPCAAVVDVFRRDNGRLVKRVVSNATTGAYSVTTADTSYHVVKRYVASVTAGNTYIDNMSVLLPLISDFNDVMGNDVIASPGVTLSSAVNDPYGATVNTALFNGTSGKIEVATSSAIQTGSGDFTIRFKFYPTSATRSGIVAYGADFYMGLDFHYNGTRNINMWASSTGSSWDILQSDGGGGNSGIGSISLTLDAWNDVEWTRSGDVWRSFVNGTKDKEVTASGTVFSGSQPLRLGVWGNGSMFMAGRIADFEFIKGVARDTASFTAPSSRALLLPTPGTPTENAQIFDYVTPA